MRIGNSAGLAIQDEQASSAADFRRTFGNRTFRKFVVIIGD